MNMQQGQRLILNSLKADKRSTQVTAEEQSAMPGKRRQWEAEREFTESVPWLSSVL